MKFEETNLPLQERVEDLLSRLTLEEKFTMFTPFHPAIERLGLPAFGVGGEGAHGIVLRDGAKSTVFPQPYGLSQTWDKELLGEIGEAIGEESRVYHQLSGDRAHLVLFFPTIDMERDPRWGRNEEAYGEDPYLAGKLAANLIRGFQKEEGFWLRGVAMPKHFYANNYEFARTWTDSILPEGLQKDYYLRVFRYAFQEGGAKSTMTAYNKINGNVGLMNPELNSVLRAQWGFDGFTVSDGGAFGLAVTEHEAGTYAEVAAKAIQNGLDIFLDNPKLSVQAVKDALAQGLLTEAEMDVSIRRQLAVLFRLGIYGDREKKNPYKNTPLDALLSQKNAEVAQRAANEGVVLLKNDGILPLASPKAIAVIGLNAGETYMDWYSGFPPKHSTILGELFREFPDAKISFADGCDTVALYHEEKQTWARVTSEGELVYDACEANRTVFRLKDYGDGFGFQNLDTGKFLTTTQTGELRGDAEDFWGWFVRELFLLQGGRFLPERQVRGGEIGVATRREVSIYDKPYDEGGAAKINATYQNLRIVTLTSGVETAKAVAAAAGTVVLAVGSHPLVNARECIDRKDLLLPDHQAKLVQAVANVNQNLVLTVVSGYPYAMEAQEAQARAVLFTAHGEQTLGKAVAQTLSGKNNPSGRLSQTWYLSTKELPDINDYDIEKNKMTYLYHEGAVLHPFGFGLSYTTFALSDVQIGETSVTVTVENTGGRDGATVAQVYGGKRLVGFARVELMAGERKTVEIPYEAGHGEINVRI